MNPFKSNLSMYSPALLNLIAVDKINELGPGIPDLAFKARLETLDFSQAVSPQKIRNETFAAACHAALWLRHDFLDESHTISQGIAHATGSYWHGLMHRREGDYWNSKYWFRRVGGHTVFSDLQAAVKQVFNRPHERNLILSGAGKEWDPFNFIDLVEKSIGSGSETEILCRNVQRLEWLLLFDYTYRQAVGV
jgi:hypothetical protein